MMILLLPLLAIFHLILLNKLTFTAWPEMISYPYLMLSGFTPYKDFIMPYPPTLVFILKFIFSLFGTDPLVLKNLTWVFILITDITIFFLLQKTTGKLKISLGFLFVFIILQSLLDGNMLWFDFASEIPILFGLIFFLNWMEKRITKNLIFTAIFFALAVTIKQTALVYLGFLIISILLLLKKFSFKEFSAIFIGFGLVFLFLFLYLVQISALEEFWNWTIFYPLTQWSNFPGYVQMTLSHREIFLLVFLTLPFTWIFINWARFLSEKKLQIFLLFFLAAIIAIYPRFSYFHLQPAIPFFILFSAGIYNLINIRQRIIYICLLGVFLLEVINFTRPFVWGSNIRFYDKTDKDLAAKISLESKGEKRIFLQGLNSSLYAFTNTFPSNNWSDNFGWYLEIPGVSEWTIQGFEKSPPAKVFWRIPSKGNWYSSGTYQPQKVVNYFYQHYIKTGNINEGIEIWSKKD